VIIGSESQNSAGHSFNIPAVSCMPIGNRIYSESPMFPVDFASVLN
jgi:hypothetical protein